MTTTISTLLRIDFYLGVGGSYPPVVSRHVSANNATDFVKALCESFPLDCKDLTVTVSQHNGGGIDIEASLMDPVTPPSNQYTRQVSFDAYVTYGHTPTDSDWADLVEALVAQGCNVRSPRSPSAVIWSTGLLCHSYRAVQPDASAIERVAKVLGQ